jgi:hypothetical protein
MPPVLLPLVCFSDRVLPFCLAGPDHDPPTFSSWVSGIVYGYTTLNTPDLVWVSGTTGMCHYVWLSIILKGKILEEISLRELPWPWPWAAADTHDDTCFLFHGLWWKESHLFIASLLWKDR